MKTVLTCGVVKAGVPNLVLEARVMLGCSQNYWVQQRWKETDEPNKFELFNQMTAGTYPDWHVFLDDDVSFAPNFLDVFLGSAENCDFALAGAARSWDSTGSHAIMLRNPFCAARRTRFVEGGPVFAVRKDAAKLLLPFDLSCSKMCGGREFAWTKILEDAGLRLGVVDCAPVTHNFRPEGATYDRVLASKQMGKFLATHDHVPYDSAMVELEHLR